MKVLDDLETQYFSFLEKKLRPRSVVVKGLPASWSEGRVLGSLKTVGLKEVEFVEVRRMASTFATERNIPSNMFQVKVICKGGIHQLLKLGSVEKFKINVSTYASSREVVQCFRCQRVGHPATNCKMLAGARERRMPC